MVWSRVILLMSLLLLDLTTSYSPDLLSLRRTLGVDEAATISGSTFPLPPNLHSALFGSHSIVKRGVDEVIPPRGDEAIINAPALQPDSQVEQQTENEKEECYFKHHRQTQRETKERPAVSKIKQVCGNGKLKRMSELIGVQYTNQYGSPHALALILSRGAGEYVDGSAKEVGRRWICKEHEAELGSNWETKGHYHFKTKQTRFFLKKFCNELELLGETSLLLPESTVKKMIHICKAERRKSLHGVDIIVADAMESFDNSEAMIDNMLNEYGMDNSSN